MNHDSFKGFEEETSSQFYDEHPEYCIRPAAPITHHYKRQLDWSRPEVREHRFSHIREICENYDIDGFELDFVRVPLYFDPDTTTSVQRRKIMTDFVRDVRRLIDRTGRNAQDRWLCVRVPSILSSHDELGIDLRKMVNAGVDMVNLSCFYFTEQQNDLAEICKMLPDTAVYMEITYCTSRNTQQVSASDLPLYTTAVRRLVNRHQINTTAHLAYQRGAAGVSFFNFVYYRFYQHKPPLGVIKNLHDRQWLARQPQWYFVDGHGQSGFNDMLPQDFTCGESYSWQLDLSPSAWLTSGVFRLMTKEACLDCSWEIIINGIELEAIDYICEPLDDPYLEARGTQSQYACFTCNPEILKDGFNTLRITMNERENATLRYFDLILK